MSNVTKRTVRQRNAYKQQVPEFVIEPAKATARYRGMWMTGLSLIAVSCVAFFTGKAEISAAVGFIVGSALVGAGYGGDDTIRRNFTIFRYDVLGHVLEDIDEETHDSGELLKPTTKEGDSDQHVLIGKFEFTKSQWAKFVTAVQANDNKINHTTIRNAGIFVNPTKNGNEYIAEFRRIKWRDNDGKMTDTAYTWLEANGIVQPPPLLDS